MSLYVSLIFIKIKLDMPRRVRKEVWLGPPSGARTRKKERRRKNQKKGAGPGAPRTKHGNTANIDKWNHQISIYIITETNSN